MKNCSGCGHFKPAQWCWEDRWDCPSDAPPRNLSLETLWDQSRLQAARIAELEKRHMPPGTFGKSVDTSTECVYCRRSDVHDEDCIVVRLAREALATPGYYDVPGVDELIAKILRGDS